MPDCEWCGKETKIHAKNKRPSRFCSMQCNLEFNHAKTKEKIYSQRFNRKCDWCGVDIYPSTKLQNRYCCDQCVKEGKAARARCRAYHKLRKRKFPNRARKKKRVILDDKIECLSCGELLPFDNFYKTERGTPQGKCKPCQKKYSYEHGYNRKSKKSSAEFEEEKRLALEKKIIVLCEKNARQAWKYWIQIKAPDNWVKRYWDAAGEPWRNRRLSESDLYRVKYRHNTDATVFCRVNQKRLAVLCDLYVFRHA